MLEPGPVESAAVQLGRLNVLVQRRDTPSDYSENFAVRQVQPDLVKDRASDVVQGLAWTNGIKPERT